MLRAILNKSWRQHPTKQLLYGHLPTITKTIQVRRTRHAGNCWRSRDGLIRDVILWTPSHDRAKTGRPAGTYIQQLCEYSGCSPGDLPEAMNNREGWQERVRDIRAGSTTTWLWWWQKLFGPVGWGCRIHWLDLFRGVRPPPTSVLDMILKILMVRFQWFWSFEEYGAPFYCHCSQDHSGPEW